MLMSFGEVLVVPSSISKLPVTFCWLSCIPKQKACLSIHVKFCGFLFRDTTFGIHLIKEWKPEIYWVARVA
jgi:hypothetical protein